jgi:hypothetical protein
MRADILPLMASTFAAAALACGSCGGERIATTTPHDAGTDADATFEADSAWSWTPPRVVTPRADSSEPFWLSQTGLYSDIAAKTLAPDLRAFKPKFALWSDAADKRRWLRLPNGERIDTSDMDHWQFPIGSMLFKEFSRDGKRLETRLIMRIGPGPGDYFMGAFLWNEDESDALFVPDGSENVRDTEHDVPRVKQCFTCHDGEAGHVLGFSSVQQPNAPAEILSSAPSAGFAVPGDDTTAQALGYLHANCAHCHNLHGAAWPDTDMDLRLQVSDVQPEDTAAYRTTIGITMSDRKLRSIRIVRHEAAMSGVYYRMSTRGPKTQMPPIGTEHVDDAGLASVQAWIESL